MRLSLTRGAAFAALALMPALAAAQNVAVPSHSPKDAIGVLSLHDPKGLWDGYASSPIAKPLGELITMAKAAPNATEFAEMEAMFAKMEADMGFSLAPDSFLSAISGLDVYALKPAAAGAEPGAVMLIKFKDPANAQKMLDFARGIHAENNPETALVESNVAGLKVFTAQDDVAMAADGGVLLIGKGASSISAAKTSTGPSTLFATDEFKSTMTTLSKKPHQIWVFGDGSAITDAIEGMNVVPSDAAAGLEALRAAKALAFTINMADSGLRVSSFVPESAMPAVQKGIFEYGVGKKLDVARALPAESLLSWASGNVSIERLVRSIANTPAGEGMTEEEFVAQLSGAMAMTGISLEEVFAATGDNMALVVERAGMNMATMSPDVDMTLLLQGKDSAKMASLSEKIAASVSQMMAAQVGGGADFDAFENGEYDGVKFLRLKRDLAQGLGGPVPAMGVSKDGYFVLSLSERSFQGTIDRLSGKTAGMDKSPLIGKLESTTGYAPQQVFALNTPRVVDIVGNMAMMFASGGMSPEEMQMMQKGFEVLKAAGPLTYTGNMAKDGAYTDFQFIMK